jgi:hypothetical protein
VWWPDHAFIGLMLGPGRELLEVECERFEAFGRGHVHQLLSGVMQLPCQVPGEPCIAGHAGLLQQPLLDGRGLGQSAVMAALALPHLLERAQRVGQKPQVVALEGRQQGAIQQPHLGLAQGARRRCNTGVSRLCCGHR